MSDATITTVAFALAVWLLWPIPVYLLRPVLAQWRRNRDIKRSVSAAELAWRNFSPRTPIRDQQYRDRIAANNDKPVGQFVEWPEITEDRLKSIYHGEK